MFGQVRVVRIMHTNSPADRSPARVQRWPSAGTRRGQYAGSALLRNEAVHFVLPGPRAVSCLVFVRAKRATDIVPQRMLDLRRGGCWHHG